MQDIQKMIKDILEKQNLSQEELAEKLKVSPAQVCRWLQSSVPNYANYIKLYNLYYEIFGG